MNESFIYLFSKITIVMRYNLVTYTVNVTQCACIENLSLYQVTHLTSYILCIISRPILL